MPTTTTTAAATTIIVGGGPAGLVAAIDLADAGTGVTVLEAKGHLGGRAHTDERDGHLFNQGPHAVYLGGRGLAELRSLGVDPQGGVPPAKGAVGLDGDRVGPLPASALSLLRTPLIRGRERLQVGRVLSGLGRLDPSELADRSAGAWLAEVFDADRPRRLVGGLMHVATYCADLDVLSADVGVGQLQLALGGVRYLHGGWASMVDQLAVRARAAGADLQPGRPARSIEVAADAVTVMTDGGPLRADNVVVAGPSPRAAGRLVDSAHLAAWAEQQRPALVATLDVGLSDLPRPDLRFAYGMDRPLYFSVHNPPARLGRGTMIHVMRYLSSQEPDETGAEVRIELEGLLDRLQPGWRDRLTTSRFLRRMVAANIVPTAESGGLAGRYPTRPPDVERAYVAGDWVGPEGHLFDASIVSARAAARAVLATTPVGVR